jgi:hypothetical protein
MGDRGLASTRVGLRRVPAIGKSTVGGALYPTGSLYPYRVAYIGVDQLDIIAYLSSDGPDCHELKTGRPRRGRRNLPHMAPTR